MVSLKIREEFLSEKKALRFVLKEKRDKTQNSLNVLRSVAKDLEEAMDVMNAVSLISQEEFKCVIEEIVTNAIQAVYGNSYTFEIESKIQRNQPEVYFYVNIDGERHYIRDDVLGGGVVDIVAFAIRITLWALNDPRTDNILAMDEPLKNLDSTRMMLLGEMIKELSKTLGLQFIIITHESELAQIADVSWWVHKKNGVSTVEKI